ncbi:hypothetical protein AAVH_05804 [Aphelenchoides avenae]|nr:hypothetical protein AAVH_05804 [Aphelenchus avenae]
MVAEASIEDNEQHGTAIDLSPAAKAGIISSLWESDVPETLNELELAGPDYSYLHENLFFFDSPDGQRYLQSDELCMTLDAQLSGGFEAALEAAFDESREQLVFRATFPHPEFLQQLVEKFVASENPRSLRQVLLISEATELVGTSASFHLPQAYDTIFPCALCTGYRTENEAYHMFVEVFHFTNRNDTSVCATVSFHMSAE